MEEVPTFPNIVELYTKNALPKEIKDTDGTLLLAPYGDWNNQPLVANRKTWRVYPNYSVDPEDKEMLIIDGTGMRIRVPQDDPDVEEMLGLAKKMPGLTVDDMIGTVIYSTIQQTGDFENEEQFGIYLALAYVKLAMLVQYNILKLLKQAT